MSDVAFFCLNFLVVCEIIDLQAKFEIMMINCHNDFAVDLIYPLLFSPFSFSLNCQPEFSIRHINKLLYRALVAGGVKIIMGLFLLQH